MTDLVHVAVEKLKGDEATEYGKVEYIIEEQDGVDVHFYGGNVHHWDYGHKLPVRLP